MKYFSPFLSLLILLTFSSSVFGQKFAKKGVWELGGTISFKSETEVYDGEADDDSETTFGFSPIVGYFVIDGLELGLMPRYETITYKNNNDRSMFAIFLAPAYNFDLKSNIFPYLSVLLGYNSITIDSGSKETTYSGFSWGPMGGIKIQLGKNALLNLGIQYLMITANPEDSKKDRIGANDLQILAGFSIFLGS